MHLSDSKGKKAAVALSGGVDSAVAAHLLKKRGFLVTGVTMIVQGGPPADGGNRSSRGPESVAQRLGIEHRWIDLRREFERDVITPFLEGYSRGITPNPCIICNRAIKFGALLREVEGWGYHLLGTGHFVLLADEPRGRRSVYRGRDRDKDQSYLFWSLKPEQLDRMITPLGNRTREEVSTIAGRLGLVDVTLPESQDICFLEDDDYPSLVENRYPGALRPGDIINRAGNLLGTHRGLARYTVGQRRGLGISHRRPLYVLEVRREDNKLIVGEREELSERSFHIRDTNFIPFENVDRPLRCSVMTRYRSQPAPCILHPPSEGQQLVEIEGGGRVIAPGQSAVFYSDDLLLGGGVIEGAGSLRGQTP